MLINNIIQTIPFFTGLKSSTLQAICQNAKIAYHQRGAVIYNQQYDEQSFFYIIHGWVKLHRVSFDGEDIITDILTNRYHFNEHLLFNEALDSIQAQALTPLKVMVIPITILKQGLQQDHQLAINLLKEAIHKQQEMTYEIEHLSIQTAAQRIGCFLLRLCGAGQNQAVRLQLPYDKTLLAIRLGMRPETFSRALGKLIKQFKIKVCGDSIYIPVLEQLVDYVCKHCSLTFPCHTSIKKPVSINDYNFC